MKYPGIVWGGLISGVLDLTAAFVQTWLRGRNPLVVLQSISSGILGAGAYKGEVLPIYVLGFLLHFLIVFTATTVYYFASRKLSFLISHAVVWGILYGIGVYLFMYYIVLPASALPNVLAFTPALILIAVMVHICCVGLPISLINRRFSK